MKYYQYIVLYIFIILIMYVTQKSQPRQKISQTSYYQLSGKRYKYLSKPLSNSNLPVIQEEPIQIPPSNMMNYGNQYNKFISNNTLPETPQRFNNNLPSHRIRFNKNKNNNNIRTYNSIKNKRNKKSNTIIKKNYSPIYFPSPPSSNDSNTTTIHNKKESLIDFDDIVFSLKNISIDPSHSIENSSKKVENLIKPNNVLESSLEQTPESMTSEYSDIMSIEYENTVPIVKYKTYNTITKPIQINENNYQDNNNNKSLNLSPKLTIPKITIESPKIVNKKRKKKINKIDDFINTNQLKRSKKSNSLSFLKLNINLRRFSFPIFNQTTTNKPVTNKLNEGKLSRRSNLRNRKSQDLKQRDRLLKEEFSAKPSLNEPFCALKQDSSFQNKHTSTKSTTGEENKIISTLNEDTEIIDPSNIIGVSDCNSKFTFESKLNDIASIDTNFFEDFKDLGHLIIDGRNSNSLGTDDILIADTYEIENYQAIDPISSEWFSSENDAKVQQADLKKKIFIERNLRFDDKVYELPTYSHIEYQRNNEEFVDCFQRYHQTGDIKAFVQIRNELNHFKKFEMKVHNDSEHNTHFYE